MYLSLDVVGGEHHRYGIWMYWMAIRVKRAVEFHVTRTDIHTHCRAVTYGSPSRKFGAVTSARECAMQREKGAVENPEGRRSD